MDTAAIMLIGLKVGKYPNPDTQGIPNFTIGQLVSPMPQDWQANEAKLIILQN